MDESGKNNNFYDFRRYPRLISFEEFCDIMSKEFSEEKMSKITGIPKELLYGPKQNKTENEDRITPEEFTKKLKAAKA